MDEEYVEEMNRIAKLPTTYERRAARLKFIMYLESKGR
jgi:hypothetical protein